MILFTIISSPCKHSDRKRLFNNSVSTRKLRDSGSAWIKRIPRMAVCDVCAAIRESANICFSAERSSILHGRVVGLRREKEEHEFTQALAHKTGSRSKIIIIRPLIAPRADPCRRYGVESGERTGPSQSPSGEGGPPSPWHGRTLRHGGNKRDFSEGLKRRGKETPLMARPLFSFHASASLTDATSAD